MSVIEISLNEFNK